MRARRRVYIANTGGTIGMRRGPAGYAPSPGFLAEQLALLPAFRSPQLPELVLHEHVPLLDSAYMTPEDWSRIARDIAANYEDFDGFVVAHGTDTMAYTAAALPFMLEGLAKPVILTGSQVPLCELRNDAYENLLTAILIAAHQPLPEVCVYFGGLLLRGCRATKVHTQDFEAFASPNCPPLGRAGVDISIDWPRVRPAPPSGTALRVVDLGQPLVGALRLFPGIAAGVIRSMLLPPVGGLVLEAYGAGTGPGNDGAFLDAIREASAMGVAVVVTSQCLEGGTALGDYAASSCLAEAGAVGGGDMTAEAALAKLRYLLSLGLPPGDVRRLIQVDLRGELSEGTASTRPSEAMPAARRELKE